VYFGVLGPLELQTGQEIWAPRGPKLKQVLALLILRANQVVGVDSLFEELWGGEPPRTALSALRTHLYHLRQTIEVESSAGTAHQLLVTQPSGYLLQLPGEHLDLQKFMTLTDQGRAFSRVGRLEEAAVSLGRALALWRGRCLVNVPHGRLITAHVSRLTELRTAALQLRIEVDLHLGRHHNVIPELRELTVLHPLDEWFHARLIAALYRSGRRGEALAAFHLLRHVLNDELGVEPSFEVQRLQADILSGREDHGRPELAALASGA
jgi:DNA-binding SARP family transcriptional activator